MSAFVVRKLQPRYLFIGCLAFVALGDFTLATFSYLKTYNDSPEVSSPGGCLVFLFAVVRFPSCVDESMFLFISHWTGHTGRAVKVLFSL